MVRKKATIVASLSVSVLGVMSVLPWGALKNVTLFGENIFGILNYTAP